MRILLLFLSIVLAATASTAGAQRAPTFISGTITDDAKRPIAGAVVGASEFGGVTDVDGRFTMGGAPGVATLIIMKPGFETSKMEITVPPASPLFGLEIVLTQNKRPSNSAGSFGGEAVRAIVQRAATEWGPRHENVVRSLDAEVREKWPGTMERSIPIVATNAIDIYVASPYVSFKTAISEAVRKMDSVVEVPYPASVAIVVSPKQIGAPDIEKIVVERSGQIVEPSGNALEMTEMTSGLGVKRVVHAGFVTYPLSAFAAGTTVRITAIPRTGSNFVVMVDGVTLSNIR